jgi:flagellar protein FlaI
MELNTELEENCARLESDSEISLADLVKNALRMRPDRVIIGEVRGSEAQDMMTAMNIGKYCMGTLHASTTREAILRLENAPMNVPSVLVNLVDVFIVMRRRNIGDKIRRVVGELVETAGMEQKMVLLSPLWTCNLATLQFNQSAVSSIYRDRLAEVSGKSIKEIIRELALRTSLINALLERKISDIESVARILRGYISNPQAVLSELGLIKEEL